MNKAFPIKYLDNKSVEIFLRDTSASWLNIASYVVITGMKVVFLCFAMEQ